MKVVLVTGGFDPLHSGHIAYFKAARELGDKLVVGLNSDAWLTRKKGKPFMPVWERFEIIQNLKIVDQVVFFGDLADADGSAKHFIKETLDLFPDDQIIFANGGDRTDKNIPEMEIENPRLSFVFGIGGTGKKNSSSWILEEWKSPRTYRQWGWYRVLDEQKGYKVKELVIEPGKSLSMQRHFKRSEHWYVLKGKCVLHTEFKGVPNTDTLTEFLSGYTIGKEVWHQGTNPYDEYCHILEVQYGEQCIEEDIERRIQ